jgi:hypothetical protein
MTYRIPTSVDNLGNDWTATSYNDGSMVIESPMDRISLSKESVDRLKAIMKG